MSAHDLYVGSDARTYRIRCWGISPFELDVREVFPTAQHAQVCLTPCCACTTVDSSIKRNYIRYRTEAGRGGVFIFCMP